MAAVCPLQLLGPQTEFSKGIPLIPASEGRSGVGRTWNSAPGALCTSNILEEGTTDVPSASEAWPTPWPCGKWRRARQGCNLTRRVRTSPFFETLVQAVGSSRPGQAQDICGPWIGLLLSPAQCWEVEKNRVSLVSYVLVIYVHTLRKVASPSRLFQDRDQRHQSWKSLSSSTSFGHLPSDRGLVAPFHRWDSWGPVVQIKEHHNGLKMAQLRSHWWGFWMRHWIWFGIATHHYQMSF